ncbi:hypothetical protein BHE74_00044772 [Ensete ventricosum]|nr:hypothetical protein BHE74_00044772 [Ensete ventricosum]
MRPQVKVSALPVSGRPYDCWGIGLTCVRSAVRLLGIRPYLCQAGRTTTGAPIPASDQLTVLGRPRRRASYMWSHLAKPFTADLRHVGCSNPHFCVSPKVSIKEQDKQEDEEAAIGNLTRGSTAAVENQSSGVVNQQPSSLTSLPK